MGGATMAREDYGRTDFQQAFAHSASAEAVYRWHSEPGALERLTPPGERFHVISRRGVEDGAWVTFVIGPLGLLWVAEHRDNIPGRQLPDVQIREPFLRWEHVHRFLAEGPDACFLFYEIKYELPLVRLDHWIAGKYVQPKLERHTLQIQLSRLSCCGMRNSAVIVG